MKKIILVQLLILITISIFSQTLTRPVNAIINSDYGPMNVAEVSGENDNQQIANQNTNKTVLELQESLPEQYKEIELVKIKWGNEKKHLKCTQGAGACGPEGIALDTFGNIYILDNLNGAVKKYNNKGKLVGIFMNEDIEFHNTENIEVSEDGKYIYGISTGLNTKYIYYYNTEKYVGEHISEGKDYQYKSIPHGVEIYKNKILVKKYGGSSELTEDNNPKDKMKEVVNIKDRNVFRTNKLNMVKIYSNDYQVYGDLDCYYIGKDSNNNYYLATYYPKKNQDWREQQRSKIVVYKYKETGDILSLMILEEEKIDYLNYRFEKHLKVNKDGDVYYLCPKKDGAVIYKYESVK